MESKAEDLVGELVGVVGAAQVITGDDVGPEIVDYRGIVEGDALAIVRPGDTTEVAAVVRACARAGAAIVCHGGNTGLSAGGVPVIDRTAVVLSLRRMAAIEQVNPSQWTMTVEAGVTIEAMQQAAASHHRKFAPDWGARGTATIGGAIATDAGGNNVLRYGNMRDQVLGLEVVLPDGRIWNGLRALRKDSSGYDLKQLFVGSEGTLGVVTRAVVKLEPATDHAQSAMATLTSLERLMELYALARDRAPATLTAFELIPEAGLRRVCDTYDLARPIEQDGDFYVLIKLASSASVTEDLGELLAEAAAQGLIGDAVVAGTPDQEERLWLIRDELPPTRLYPDTQKVGLKLDTAVPIDRMADFHDGVRAIAAEVTPSALAYGFGHVGDGNLHMMVLPVDPGDVPEFSAQRPELVRRVDELTFALGGTLSAEHGVGRDLRDRVRGQKPDIEWELMSAVKRVFDPDGVMNPGALLPD